MKVKNKIIISISTAFFSFLITNNAIAQETDNLSTQERIDKLEAEMKELKSAQKEQQKGNSLILPETFKNTIINGRLHIDGKWYNERGESETADDRNDNAEIERARFSLYTGIDDNFDFYFEENFNDNRAYIGEAWLGYNKSGNYYIRVGQFIEPFTIENLQNSNHIAMIDYSPQIVLLPGYSVGIQSAVYGNDKLFLMGGIYGDGSSNAQYRSDDSNYSTTVRGVYTPINNYDNLLHLGLDASYRRSNRTIDSSGIPNDIDIQTLYAGELVFRHKANTFRSEFIFNKVKYDGNSSSYNGADVNYHGFYVQNSFFLTGERRAYRMICRTPEGIKVNNPVNKNGFGAWELTARYGMLDRNDTDGGLAIDKGKKEEMTVGINWYLNDYVRLMADITTAIIDYNDGRGDEKYDLFGMRAQVKF